MIYVIAAIAGVFILVSIPIAFVLTKDGLARQKRITQMKRFRNSVRSEKAGFTDADRRTIA